MRGSATTAGPPISSSSARTSSGCSAAAADKSLARAALRRYGPGVRTVRPWQARRSCARPAGPLGAERSMTYVVTEACIKCKYMDCVEVCPVDCFYEGEVMLVINPNECIDCGVCEPECTAEAILPDTKSGLEKWL